MLDHPHPFHNKLAVTGGLLADESAELLRSFFRASREAKASNITEDKETDDYDSRSP